MAKFSGNSRREYDKAMAEIVQLKDRILRYQEQNKSLMSSVHTLEKAKESQKAHYEEIIAERDATIKELRSQIAHYAALAGHDGTNTGMPTSQTPPDKEKRIPNTRTKTGKPKGGQKGHPKAGLQEPDDSAVTDTVKHDCSAEGFACPSCGGENYIPTGDSEVKYEYDVRIKVVKVKHVFYYYECVDCGTVFRSMIPPSLKEKAQYGNVLQALALSLMNTVNAPMNKTAMFLAGITGDELSPCSGYVAKLQKRGADGLAEFESDLRLLLIQRAVVYWDDTVIMINTMRACLRFYGDETIAFYTAHEHKDKPGLDEDNVLPLLTSAAKTMHDHNTVNYNDDYSFQNLECNQHLQRDCMKNSNDTCHTWSADLKDCIGSAIHDRNEAISHGASSFEAAYINGFYAKVDAFLSDGWEQNKKEQSIYGADFERALLRRIEKYKANYFMWLEDFSLPTTNNLSERGLRGVKSHMKISGQFESIESAKHYARLHTYIETCRRNHINEIDALQRLCGGNPYSVAEIFSTPPPQ